MTTGKLLPAYIDAIRGCFVARTISNAGKPFRWGQFIDTAKAGSQVGLYGAIAGAICLKADGKAGYTDAAQAQSDLEGYWNNRAADSKAEDNLCQNIRLAALFLGLCFGTDGNNATAQDVGTHLLSHRHPQSKLWPESSLHNDSTPIEESEYASSIVLIFIACAIKFLAGNENAFANLTSEARASARALQQKFLNDPLKKRPHLFAMLIAVRLNLGEQTDSKVRKRLRREFLYKKPDLTARLPHYLDYQRDDGSSGRDYFIAPLELLAPLLLLQQDISNIEHLYADRVNEAIKDAIDKSADNKGLYCEGVSRPSTLEQSMVVLALAAGNRPTKTRWTMLPAKLWTVFRKERERGDFALAWVIICGVYVPFALSFSGASIIVEYGAHLPSIIETIIKAIEVTPRFWVSAAVVAAGGIRKPQDVAMQALGKK